MFKLADFGRLTCNQCIELDQCKSYYLEDLSESCTLVSNHIRRSYSTYGCYTNIGTFTSCMGVAT